MATKAVTCRPPIAIEIPVAAVPGQEGEGADADRLQDRAQDQGAAIAEAHRGEAAQGDAGQGAAKADGGAHRGDGRLADAKRRIERVAHRPAHIVAQVEGGDHGQHQERQAEPVGGEELDKRPDHRIIGAAQGVGLGLAGLGLHHHVGPGRLLDHQRRRQAHDHQGAIDGVGYRPADRLGDHQDQGLGGDQGGAVAQGIGGGEQAELIGVGRRLDPPRVDHRILRRRRYAGDEAEGGEEAKLGARIGAGHGDQAHADADLGKDHPAAPAAKKADQRRRDAIDHRPPQELHRIGEADPRQEADRRQLDLVVRQPEPQGVADQHEGQARREAQQQHQGDLRPAKRRQHLAHGPPAARMLRTSVVVCCHCRQMQRVGWHVQQRLDPARFKIPNRRRAWKSVV